MGTGLVLWYVLLWGAMGRASGNAPVSPNLTPHEKLNLWLETSCINTKVPCPSASCDFLESCYEQVCENSAEQGENVCSSVASLGVAGLTCDILKGCVDECGAACRLRDVGIRNKTTVFICSQPLPDEMPILEKLSLQDNYGRRVLTFQMMDESNDMMSLCTSEQIMDKNKEKVFNAISRGLKFYERQRHQIDMKDLFLDLILLKVVDDRHEKIFQNRFPLSHWIQQACDSTSDKETSRVCHTMRRDRTRPKLTWRSTSILANQAKTIPAFSVGRDEQLGGPDQTLQCLAALVNDCQVPPHCESVFFEKTPNTQYVLAFQLFFRIILTTVDCPSLRHYADPLVNDKLCAKMLQEAQLVSQLGYPEAFRDLFAQYVASCGIMRYPNFFREDWLQNLLSWQSESELGCFTRAKENQSIFITTDTPIKRQATTEGELEGEEECLPHFTKNAMLALTMYWDYLQDNCA